MRKTTLTNEKTEKRYVLTKVKPYGRIQPTGCAWRPITAADDQQPWPADNRRVSYPITIWPAARKRHGSWIERNTMRTYPIIILCPAILYIYKKQIGKKTSYQITPQTGNMLLDKRHRLSSVIIRSHLYTCIRLVRWPRQAKAEKIK